MKRTLILASFLTSLALTAGTARALVLWEFSETGGDVVGVLSGTLDLTGMTFDRSGFSETAILPSRSAILSGGQNTDVYVGPITGPASFGSGLKTNGTGSGSVFGFLPDRDSLTVASGFTGGAVSGTLTFAGTDFATLGITQGVYHFELPVDRITVRFGDTPTVPLPAGGVLLVSALAALALRRKRA